MAAVMKNDSVDDLMIDHRSCWLLKWLMLTVAVMNENDLVYSVIESLVFHG